MEGKYIKYNRISKVITSAELVDIFDDIVKKGMDIIFYSEKILEKAEIERLAVTIIVGKINVGKELLSD